MCSCMMYIGPIKYFRVKLKQQKQAFAVPDEAGAYRLPVPVPKMNFFIFGTGTGRISFAAPYRI